MKSLICINTAKRSSAIKALVWPYIEFCKKEESFDFVVSLDGCDESTISFCNKYNIPLLYSEQCEGVGLAKNRVLCEYPDHDYYFFIEDDTALLNAEVFRKYIKAAGELNLHHLSLFEESRLIDVIGEVSSSFGIVLFASYGSAQFNFFTKKGIEVVGGFHPEFAKYCRYGHTEHSYRFVNNGLSNSAFCVLKDCFEGYFKFSDPISVTKRSDKKTKNRLFHAEQALIDDKLKFVPIQTLCAYTVPESLSLEYTKIPINRSFYEKFYWIKISLLDFARNLKKALF